MKKIFGLGLALLLLVGCSSNGGGTVTPTTTPEATAETTAEATAEATASASAESTVEVSRGTVADGVYTNESLGLSITIPDTFVSLNDEQLLSMITTAVEGTSLENIGEMIAQQTVTYDFGMVKASDGSVMLVGIENLTLEQAEGLVTDEETYLSFAKSSFASQQGASYTYGDPYTKTIGGNTWTAMDILEENNGIYSTVVVRKSGNLVFAITMNAKEQETLDEMMGLIAE